MVEEVSTYRWRTDAASGEVEAASPDAAVDRLIDLGEWSVIDSREEEDYISDGAWLLVHDADGCPVLRRGQVP